MSILPRISFKFLKIIEECDRIARYTPYRAQMAGAMQCVRANSSLTAAFPSNLSSQCLLQKILWIPFNETYAMSIVWGGGVSVVSYRYYMYAQNHIYSITKKAYHHYCWVSIFENMLDFLRDDVPPDLVLLAAVLLGAQEGS